MCLHTLYYLHAGAWEEAYREQAQAISEEQAGHQALLPPVLGGQPGEY